MALSRGHVDLTATLKDGSLSASLRDDTAQVEPGSVQRDIADVALVVTDAARYTRPRELAGADYNYLGPLGSVVYHLPAIQQKGIIWPGWNTQGVDYSKLAGGVRLNLANVKGPGNLRIATPGAPGERRAPSSIPPQTRTASPSITRRTCTPPGSSPSPVSTVPSCPSRQRPSTVAP
ncbi:hypothetical protein SAMN02910418_00503 [Bowdeniella nasicola]|uniref:Uncharacterized protein n=1 Tax=Bowdeniella nasicola TaxID=208480 RepID=A0A1H3WUL2_9ACTO|nr:choice-of-anchor M domain-containing protein [Bowdeniella nasicola]SDZ90836.1 hypothetical protein SAMN02910418_00503 [Bowdeniella nasicola]